MILIVGGAGYIGSHVNKELNKRGYNTIVYDNLIYGHKEFVKWGIFEFGDLNDKKRLNEIFDKYKIDAVMHFAAYAYVGESVKEPSKYYNNNVCNTINLLDVMIAHDVKHFIFSSSCATYGEPIDMPIVEDAIQRPINPYGKTKLIIEKLLEDYEKAYGLHYSCLRYFNAAGDDPDCDIGELHNPETHIIPLTIYTALGKLDSFSIYGTDYSTFDGTCIRDYIHVLDLADAHIKALMYIKQNNKSENFNLGTENGTSVLEIIEEVKKVSGKEFLVNYAKKRPGDPAVLVGSNKKAKKLLNWEPNNSKIEYIIKTAWDWHKKHE